MLNIEILFIKTHVFPSTECIYQLHHHSSYTYPQYFSLGAVAGLKEILCLRQSVLDVVSIQFGLGLAKGR